MSNSDVQDLSKESVGKLVSRLTLGQLWKVGGALIVLLSGSFYFGYWMSSSIYKNEISSISGDLDSTEKKLKDKEDRIQLLHMKELLLGKIVLYRHYQAETQRNDTTENQKQYKNSGEDLFNFVNVLMKKTIAGGTKPTAEVHVGKGISPTLTFEFDMTKVPLPREVFATLY